MTKHTEWSRTEKERGLRLIARIITAIEGSDMKDKDVGFLKAMRQALPTKGGLTVSQWKKVHLLARAFGVEPEPDGETSEK